MLLTNAHVVTHHYLAGCGGERHAAQHGGRHKRLIRTSQTPPA